MSDAEFAALESVTIEARFAEDDEITIRYELAEGSEDKGEITFPEGGVYTFHLSEVDDGDNHLPGNSRGNPMLNAKEGYAFDHWTLKQDAGFLSYDKEFQPTIEDVAGATQWSNRSYVAHFADDKKVSFHYKVAEGQEHMGQIDKPEGGSDEFWISKEPELARASAKDGYVFDHWSLEGDGTFYGDDEDLSPSKGDAAGGEWNDRSYVAHFVENKEITIRYEVAEGQEHMGVIVDPEGGSQTGKISNLQWSLMGVAEAKRGYAFDHWSLEGDGTFYGDDEYLNPAKKDAEDRLWSDRSYVAHFVRDFGGSDPKLSIGASIDETYDGAPRKIEANMAKPLAGDFIEYSTDGSTWSAECLEFADVALDGDGNAVARTIYARVTNGEKHTKPVSATLMIRMRPLSITPASYSVTYDGQLHGLKPDSPISAKQGLVDGHTLDEAKLGAKTSFGPSVSFDNVLEIDPDSVQIMSGGDDVTENYEITLETGLLTIRYASLWELFNYGKLEVSAIPDQTYTGAPIEPALTMRHSGMTLVKDVDYSPSYSDNINVGMGAVSVNGMGNYVPEGGNIRLDFKIVPQAAALNVRQSGRVWSEGMSIDEAAIRALFDVNDASGTPLDGNLYTVRVTDEAERPVNLPITQPGVYAITATLTTDNYRFKEGGAEKAAASFDYSLLPKLELHFEGKTFTYDGAAHFLPAAVCEGATITYALSENAPEAERYESIESAALGLTETGSVTIYARAEKARYAPLTASAVLEVAKRPITIVASDNRADYDGQPHGAQPAQPFFVSDDEGMGLAPGDAVDANRVVIPASKTDAGAYAGLLEIARA